MMSSLLFSCVVLLLCCWWEHQPVLGLLQSDFYRLSSNETYTLPEGDDGAEPFALQSVFSFNGSLFYPIYVCNAATKNSLGQQLRVAS